MNQMTGARTTLATDARDTLESRRRRNGQFGAATQSAPETSLAWDVIGPGVYEDTDAGQVTRDDNGHLHSFNDAPALISGDGTKSWYDHGTLIRKERADGTHILFDEEGNLHGDPAIEYSDGEQHFFVHGELIKVRQPGGSVETLGAIA